MQHEISKLTRITDELLTFLLTHGAKDIQLNLKREGKTTYIELRDMACTFTKELIEEIAFELSTHRQHEVEGYYWQLAGEDEDGEELVLVGSMVDTSSVTLEGSNLVIKLSRDCL